MFDVKSGKSHLILLRETFSMGEFVRSSCFIYTFLLSMDIPTILLHTSQQKSEGQIEISSNFLPRTLE